MITLTRLIQTVSWTNRSFNIRRNASYEASSQPRPIQNTNPLDYRLPKRRVLLLFGYIGTGYAGLQRNPGVKTIEDELESALYKAGAISEMNYGDLQKLGWKRVSRTDKGVHALGQVISFKMQKPETTSYQAMRDKINDNLPSSIRIFDIVHVPRKFVPDSHIHGRVYHYLVPTRVLPPGTERARLADALRNFIGTHYFHNYTIRKQPTDPSTRRYITNIEVKEGFVAPDGEVYWAVHISGQSFMIHQIRKMIGTVIAVLRDGKQSPEVVLRMTLTPTPHALPVAPAFPLYLGKCEFKLRTLNEIADVRFDSAPTVVAQHSFEKDIHKHIFQVDKTEPKVFEEWLETMRQYPLAIDQILRNETTAKKRSLEEEEATAGAAEDDSGANQNDKEEDKDDDDQRKKQSK